MEGLPPLSRSTVLGYLTAECTVALFFMTVPLTNTVCRRLVNLHTDAKESQHAICGQFDRPRPTSLELPSRLLGGIGTRTVLPTLD